MLLFLAILLLAVGGSAFGSSVSTAAFTGGTGTVSVGGTLYAKNGGALTLTVSTSNDTKCVEITGAHAARLTSSTAKSTWTFSFTAGTGNGLQTVTAAASPNFNANNCAGQSQNPQNASYVLDNAGPTVNGTLSPAPNAAGWNNSNVTINWSAIDSGSGVASGPTPASDNQNMNTAGATKTSTATDRLGNVGNGSVTVKLDKMAPTISGSGSPGPNLNGWNKTDVTVSFSCSDGLSGIKSCSGPTTRTAESASADVTGTAVDNADNSTPTTVLVKIDKTSPSLSGTPTTSPDANGWYKSNVTIDWTCSDALSGIDGSCPADTTISSEGTGLFDTKTVSDKAGNSTTANSSPTVKIDKTAPNTNASAVNAWNNVSQTITLTPNDALSGVDATHYTVDGGATQTGASVSISSEGDHTLEFWSVDKAGNEETHHVVQIGIDLTPPTIAVTVTPAPNGNGWNNSDVTVHFECADQLNLPGIASCTDDQVVTTEGTGQEVDGTAVDNAGNSTNGHASVSLDKAPPTINGGPDRAANGNGWYNANVVVSFSCGDSLSGVGSCPSPVTLGEGADQSASGTAYDKADNSASASADHVNVDKTNPTITATATKADSSAYVPGNWTSQSVTVHFTCSDALSGLDGSCPSDVTITGSTAAAGQTVSGSVSDRAGNHDSASVLVKVDKDAPVLTIGAPADNSTVSPASVAVFGTASDTPSGLQSLTLNGTPTSVAVDGTFSTTVSLACGANTITGVATDMVGNQTTRSVHVTRSCLWISSVLPPVASPNVGDPASTTLNAFKIRSTIPIKFQVYTDQARTQLLTTPPAGSTARLTLVKQDNSTETTDLTDTLSGAANTDNIFRWTGSPDYQYIYNLGTSGRTAGTYFVQLTLYASDGTTVLGQSARQYFVLRS